MGLFNNNLEIDIENPFKNDKLQREEEVKNLTALFDIVDNQMVLAVNSQWGTGKTSFLKMWNQYLMNEGYKTVFFNAWENDYVEDPFIAFVNEIRESINDEDKVKSFIEKAKKVGLALVKQSPKMVSKMIKENTGFDSGEIVSDDELAKMLSDKIDNYDENKKSVDKFKKELGKIADKEFEESKKPIVIFVDELDRCIPDYAISLLERIKHFFNAQNIIFILGIDKEALSNSIKVIYGYQTDVAGYLTRFIDLEYRLKETNRKLYVEYLLSRYKFNELFEKRSYKNRIVEAEHMYSDFSNVMIQITEGFKISLRDIEKFVVEVYMIFKANINKCVYVYPLILLCVLKRIDKPLYNKLKFNQIQYKELILILKQKNENIENWLEDIENCIFKAYLIWLLDDNTELNRLKHNISKLEEDNLYENRDIRCLEFYDYVVNGKGYMMAWHDREIVKKYIFSKVELYDNFTMIKEE